jgi:hypothetical protein
MSEKRIRYMIAIAAAGAVVVPPTPTVAAEGAAGVSAVASHTRMDHHLATEGLSTAPGIDAREPHDLDGSFSASPTSLGTLILTPPHADADADRDTKASCARRPDFHNSCVCPSSYQVVVYWNSTSTGASNMWSGSTHTHMTQNRGPGSGWPNPVTKYGKGTHAHYTGRQGPVYYARGGGAAGAVVNTMWAVCSRSFIASE